MRMPRELDNLYPDVPDHFEEVWFGDWSDYDEYSHLIIVRDLKTHQYYRQKWNYNELVDSKLNPMTWNPDAISEREAIHDLLDWNAISVPQKVAFQGW